MIHVLSGKGITNVAGVIRVSYPANSTLVITGTVSGKQFAKDTNTTSSAKAYIFLAPNGDASYTLTATNTAGKTVSKQVYVAKDQVQSVVLTYELYLFSGSETWTLKQRLKGYGAVTTSNNTLTLTGEMASGGSASLYSCSAFYPSKVAKGEYSTLKVTISSVTEPTNVYLIVQDDTTANPSGENYIAYVRITEAGTFTLPYPDGSRYVGLSVGGTSKVVASKVWLE